MNEQRGCQQVVSCIWKGKSVRYAKYVIVLKRQPASPFPAEKAKYELIKSYWKKTLNKE